MKLKPLSLIVAAFLVVAAVVLLFIRKGSEAAPPAPSLTPEKIAEQERDLLKVEAVFFGKVVDQSENGVPDVKVFFARAHRQSEADGLIATWETVTDANGAFAIKRTGAPDLNIGIVPPAGYRSADESRTRKFLFHDAVVVDQGTPVGPKQDRFHKHVADPKNPVVFRLLKLAEPEAMLPRKYSNYSSKTDEINIGDGMAHKLKVKVDVDPNPIKDVASGKTIHRWTATLAVPSGGLSGRNADEALGTSSFVAPLGGYQPEIIVSFDEKSAPDDYVRIYRKEFYLRFSDGTYARARVKINADPKDPLIHVESWYNPGGGRGTEFDPAKKVK